jgi:beta-1,4-mannooligosaccharide/beta-1,4-mannosyl-N-acetylglucosamine phosphorylase
VFSPITPYELTGDVAKVVFPCGWIVDEATDELRMYYGAADSSIGLATAKFSDVLARVHQAPGPA